MPGEGYLPFLKVLVKGCYILFPCSQPRHSTFVWTWVNFLQMTHWVGPLLQAQLSQWLVQKGQCYFSSVYPSAQVTTPELFHLCASTPWVSAPSLFHPGSRCLWLCEIFKRGKGNPAKAPPNSSHTQERSFTYNPTHKQTHFKSSSLSVFRANTMSLHLFWNLTKISVSSL